MLAGATLSKRRARRRERPREPFIGRPCLRCGSATLVTPCARCDGWFVVCDCAGDDAFDTYLSTAGSCPRCRL